MIRNVRSRQLEIPRELSRIARSIQQRQQNPGTSRVGHRPTQPVHHIETRSKSQHTLTIHSPLNRCESGSESEDRDRRVHPAQRASSSAGQMLEMPDGFLEQFGDMIVEERVVDVPAVARADDQAQMPQQPQMV